MRLQHNCVSRALGYLRAGLLASGRSQSGRQAEEAERAGGSAARPRLSLLVVDSPAALVAGALGGQRGAGAGHVIMACLGRALRALARRFLLAVLTTNHVVRGALAQHTRVLLRVFREWGVLTSKRCLRGALVSGHGCCIEFPLIEVQCGIQLRVPAPLSCQAQLSHNFKDYMTLIMHRHAQIWLHSMSFRRAENEQSSFYMRRAKI